MKSKKIMRVIAVVYILIMICVNIYSNIYYVKIGGKKYKKDTKEISVYSLNDSDIKKINKCTEIEQMHLSGAGENSFTKFENFHNLNCLMIGRSELSSADSEKISTFDNLKDLIIDYTTVDFKGFNSDTVSTIHFLYSNVKNFEALAECSSLKHIGIHGSIISDCIDNNYVMKDSSVFASFDYVESLWIDVGKIEDVSGFLEMDSLKEFTFDKGTLSEDDKRLLEDKGISVIEND